MASNLTVPLQVLNSTCLVSTGITPQLNEPVNQRFIDVYVYCSLSLQRCFCFFDARQLCMFAYYLETGERYSSSVTSGVERLVSDNL